MERLEDKLVLEASESFGSENESFRSFGCQHGAFGVKLEAPEVSSVKMEVLGVWKSSGSTFPFIKQ